MKLELKQKIGVSLMVWQVLATVLSIIFDVLVAFSSHRGLIVAILLLLTFLQFFISFLAIGGMCTADTKEEDDE